MKYIIDYLRECNPDLLIKYCVDKHMECSFDKENLDVDKMEASYRYVLDKCKNFSEYTWFRKKYTFKFEYIPEFLSSDSVPENLSGHNRFAECFIHCFLRNKNYIKPAEGLKPWGGKGEDPNDAPEGYYNCNYDDHNEKFAVHMPWRIIVNLEAEFDESVDGFELEELMAEFLWEITFDGFEENSYQGLRKLLEDRDGEKTIPWEDVKKELNDFMENRNPDETETTTDDGFKIRFSESAVEDLKDMIREEQQSDFDERD